MKLRERIAKLIEVKTIVTLTMLGVFSYLAVAGKITAKEFLELFKTVIVFFFGVQAERHVNAKEEKSNDKNS